MNLFIETYALLFAIAVPVLTLAGMNLALALGGERGTLLLPSAGPFELALRAANTVPATTARATPDVPANEPEFRHAA